MKNGFHIKRDFPGVSTRTYGRAGVYACEVDLPNGDRVKALGSTLELAEDTAWHAVKATLNPSHP
jgi:hypothetical protein